MGKLIDLTGRKFNFWTVTGRGRTEPLSPGYVGTRLFWKVRCVCGTEHEVQGTVLKAGKSQSCGCKTAQLISAEFTTHGHTRRKKPTGSYTSWANMIQRCNDPKSKDFPYYGGRGIKVCARWRIFENFLADMGERPAGLTIERQDNNGDYERSNCIWATRKQQGQNRRKRR